MENTTLFAEVEDIMCDQVILSRVDVDFKTESSKLTITTTRFRLAVTLLVKTVLPAVVSVYYAYLRNKHLVVENVRRQYLPSIIAFIANNISRSLSCVQRRITYRLTFKQITDASESINVDIDEIPEKCVECIVLSEPIGPIKADIIFVHGLHGGLSKTWRQGTWRHERHKLRNESLKRGLEIMEFRKQMAKTKQSDICIESFKEQSDEDDFIEIEKNLNNEFESKYGVYSPCWPQDWLPQDCPGIRVIAINYTTDPYLWRPVWVKKRNRTSMTERSKEMIEHLLQKGVGQNPIIWVGHSKGGLFIKQIIADSYEKSFDAMGIENLHFQTKAITFYSVPHKGSFLADVVVPFLKHSIELIEIQRNCQFVLNLHDRFLKLFEDKSFNPEILSFIETSFTLMSVFYLKIVTFDSADPGIGVKIGVPLDHREICKPAGRDCFLYLELVKLIENVFSKCNT